MQRGLPLPLQSPSAYQPSRAGQSRRAVAPVYEAPADATHRAGPAAKPRTFWQKLGGRSLTISIVLHTVILLIGLVWIFQIIPNKTPDVDFLPKGGGGGQLGAKSETNMKKRATMTTMNAPRLVAKNAVSTFSLPEPDPASALSSVGALGSSGMAAGLGGSGSGGGKGDGKGKGFGNGTGPGMGGRGGMNPFGMLDPNANALTGILYDTKQTNKQQATNLSEPQFLEVVSDFVKRGWNERSLEKFYQVPNKLHLTRLYIPAMDASAAPKAFNSDIAPSRWVIVYRGVVSPPKTGHYHFVGCADDMIAVRFNGKPVLDAGYASAYFGKEMSGPLVQVFTGRANNKDMERELRHYFKVPASTYQYPTTSVYNVRMNGLLVGEDFEAREGSSYPIEILISEVPGAVFGACLLIEEVGATYQKASTGAPILPLFRLDAGVPEPTSDSTYSPPYDPQGPVWKFVGGSGKLGI